MDAEAAFSPPLASWKGTVGSAELKHIAKDRIAWCFFGLALAAHLSVVVGYVGQPLLDQHNFRQTQTALSTWWLLHDRGWLHWFNYETPVFGSPWQIPLEFPLFQWLVALSQSVTGLPLDALGRSVSAAMFYATLWPVWVFVRDCGLRTRSFLIAAAILLCSPLYIYWSRAFLIESTALFFSVLYVASLRRYVITCRWPWLLVNILAGVLGALSKVTTFVVFAAAAVLVLVIDFAAHRPSPKALKRYLLLLPGLLFSALCLVLWLHHAERITASSYFGHILAPSHLNLWNYGTLTQRLSPLLWKTTIWRRVVPECIGSQWLLLLGLPLLWHARGLWRWGLAGLLALFLLPFLLFTNLHIVHNYYSYANGVFLLLALALCLSYLGDRHSTWVFALACTLTVFAEWRTFYRSYLPSARADFSHDPLLETAAFLRSNMPPDSVLLITGIDWNPALTYYSQRRSICVPQWVNPQEFEALLQNPARLSGGKPVSALVNCRAGFWPANAELWRDFVARLSAHSKVGCFGQFQAVVPPGPGDWAAQIAEDALSPLPSNGQTWARHLPLAFDIGATTKGQVRLQRAVLNEKALAGHTPPVLAPRGAKLLLRGRLGGVSARDPAAKIILGLSGDAGWAWRFSWPAAVSIAPAEDHSACDFDLTCSLPNDLPEDNYQVWLFCPQKDKLIAAASGFRLRILAPWIDQLPPEWTVRTNGEALGALDELKVDGKPISCLNTAFSVKHGSVLQLQGWAIDKDQWQAYPKALLVLEENNTGSRHFIEAHRYWRGEVAQYFNNPALGNSGFRVVCTLPAQLPNGQYRLSLLQQRPDSTVELALPAHLKLEP